MSSRQRYVTLKTASFGMLFFSLIYSLLIFFNAADVSPKVMTWMALISSVCCVITFKINDKIATFGLCSVLLLYTICTQFGMVIVYFLLGESFVSDYQIWTLAFLYSENLSRAIALGIISITIYTIVVYVVSSKSCSMDKRQPAINKLGDNEKTVVVYIGYAMLAVTFLYLLYFLATGQISLHSSYNDFISNVSKNNLLWNYMLIIYATGIAYVVAAGNKKQLKTGLIMYGATALILFLTGNKGEVLYATLACVGVYQYRGNKMSMKLALMILMVVFVIIPVITASRGEGVLGSLSGNGGLNGGSFTSAFTEMGMQIRLSAYVLDEFQNGTRSLIWGYSYYSPFVNIIDRLLFNVGIRIPAPASYNFVSRFPGYGFSQIAEAYCNFGLTGVMIFHFLLGLILSKIESRKEMLSPAKLAYFTSIITILINATRNRFSFVPGQILIMSMIYLLIKLICQSKKRKI